jgi:hypothetical protein
MLIGSLHHLEGQVFQLDTLTYTGDINKHINVVILGDGYLEEDLVQFLQDAENFTTYFFQIQPYSNYKGFFNVFTLSVPSMERGAASHPDSLIDNYFGSTFWYADIERLLVPTNSSRIFSVLAENFPAYDQVFMLVNSTKYGGSGGWVATASLNNQSKEVALHELGHSFANLSDEYWAGDQYARENTNMTKETNLEQLVWRNWHGDAEIGLFPHEESPAWHRPHQDCKMRYLNRPFCAICIEGTIESIYDLASPLRNYYPENAVLAEPEDPQIFSLDLIKPNPNTLKVTWDLNGKIIQSGLDTLLLDHSELMDGENSVVAVIEDTTVLIRPYDDESYHFITVQWQTGSGTANRGGLENYTGIQVFHIYPNPVEDELYITVKEGLNDQISFDLSDLQGKRMRTWSLDFSQKTTLDLSEFESGIYILHIHVNGRVINSRKIIKQ